MSAADEVLKLRQELVSVKIERDTAKAEAINAKSEARWAQGEAVGLKNAVTNLINVRNALQDNEAKLLGKLTWWRVMAMAEGLMLLGVWANTYLFGGAA